jgi:hypothetical protein
MKHINDESLIQIDLLLVRGTATMKGLHILVTDFTSRVPLDAT